MDTAIKREIIVPPEYIGMRMDKALALLFPEFSRSQLKTWIESNACTLDYHTVLPKTVIKKEGIITLNAVLPNRCDALIPEAIPLDIVYKDEDLLIINKPSNLVVHPGNGNDTGTLVNALLYLDPELQKLPRAGLIHRLDKDTTGLLLVARNIEAFNSLIEQMSLRQIKRQYLGLVWGKVITGDVINAPIGRDVRDRVKMAVRDNGREAITHFRVKERFKCHTLLDIKLETGRTHQIRVHMAHIGHPMVGDSTYGRRARNLSSPALNKSIQQFTRQALHAYSLELTQPLTGESITVAADLPQDFQQLLSELRQYEYDYAR